MNLQRLWPLAWRQSLRDSRSAEVRILFTAVLIAVTLSTSLGYLGMHLTASLHQQASEFLGADLLLTGNAPATSEQLELAQTARLTQAQALEFSSVIATDTQFQLSSIKAVSSGYPLRGQLRSKIDAQQAELLGGQPASGEIWAEANLLNRLSLHLGDSVEVGRQKLRLTRILTYEPDQPEDFYSLMPRVIMHLDDVPQTGILQPGSQVRYRMLWTGTPEALNLFRSHITPLLKAGQRLESIQDRRESRIGRALTKAEHYLGLASLTGILLSGIAVALAASRFARRRLDACALLRCLGLSGRATLGLYSLQLLLLGLTAGILGAILGGLFQYLLLSLLEGMLDLPQPSVSIYPAVLGVLSGLIIIAGFALPPLAALGRTPPIRVLRRDTLPTPTSQWLTQGAALIALTLIMWQLSANGFLTAIFALSLLLLAALATGLLWLVVQPVRPALANRALHWRLGLGQLLRHPKASLGQTLAFGLILMTMALVLLLRLELISNWQTQLSSDHPNHFAINLQPAEQRAFSEQIQQIIGQAPQLYPVVRGRLTARNDHPLTSKPDSQGERALRRDLNLTWSQTLPKGNTLVAGSWWPAPSDQRLPYISIDERLAENLGIQLQDILTFDFGDTQLKAQVSSLRQVNWDELQPNFYIIFEPGALDAIASTGMASFRLPTEQDAALVPVVRAFPGMTLIPLADILNRLQSILAQVSLAIELVLLLILAAGLTVLFAGLLASLDERLRQSAVLRALGASRGLLQRARLTEFALMGAASGLVAALGCELSSALLYQWVFRIDWHPHPWLLSLPLLGALLVTVAGLLGTRRVLHTSPLVLLKEG